MMMTLIFLIEDPPLLPSKRESRALRHHCLHRLTDLSRDRRNDLNDRHHRHRHRRPMSTLFMQACSIFLLETKRQIDRQADNLFCHHYDDYFRISKSTSNWFFIKLVTCLPSVLIIHSFQYYDYFVVTLIRFDSRKRLGVIIMHC